jgi:hypothetical protein
MKYACTLALVGGWFAGDKQWFWFGFCFTLACILAVYYGRKTDIARKRRRI